MNLRFPTEEDREHILRMALEFKSKSPYAEFPYDENKLHHVITQFIKSDGSDKICVLAVDENNTPFGMVAGLTAEFFWNTDRHAGELIWWVDENKRRGTAGIRLHDAFEYWAWKIGCTHINMLYLEQDDPVSKKLGNYYRKRGYTLVENCFIKRIR